MDLGELTRSAFDSVRSHKLRSFHTLLGIIIGVTTIVGVASVISGLEEYVQTKVIQLSPDVFVMTKFGIIRSREEFLQAIKRPDLDFRDVDVLSRTLALADAVCFRRCMCRASLRNRRTCCGSAANSGRRILIATVLPSRESSALNTVPIPPSPSIEINW